MWERPPRWSWHRTCTTSLSSTRFWSSACRPTGAHSFRCASTSTRAASTVKHLGSRSQELTSCTSWAPKSSCAEVPVVRMVSTTGKASSLDGGLSTPEVPTSPTMAGNRIATGSSGWWAQRSLKPCAIWQRTRPVGLSGMATEVPTLQVFLDRSIHMIQFYRGGGQMLAFEKTIQGPQKHD